MMQKIKILLIFSILAITVSACLKAPVNPEDEEITTLKKYMHKNYPDIKPTKSGLYFIPQKTGYGNTPINGDTLIINYIGTFLDGREFDNTYSKETPFSYTIGSADQLISGFKEGILKLREGQTALLIMPSKLAYGDRQNGMIPSYSSLIFNVEMHKIIHTEK